MLVHAIEDVLHKLPPERSHGLFEIRKEGEPIDVSIIIEGLLEYLKLIFLEENAIGIQRLSYWHKYVLEIKGLDFSRNLTIIVNEGSVNGTNIWGVFVARELQPDLKQKFIDLGIKFYAKEWHFSFFYL